MKVEDLSAFLVQWFYHKHKVLPKGDRSSWKNYTRSAAQNATTKSIFIAMEKINMGIRNTSAKNASTNSHQIPSKEGKKTGKEPILPALFMVKQPICTMIMSITHILLFR